MEGGLALRVGKWVTAQGPMLKGAPCGWVINVLGPYFPAPAPHVELAAGAEGEEAREQPEVARGGLCPDPGGAGQALSPGPALQRETGSARRAMEGEPPGPGEQALQEFQALVELVGGKPEVLLVGEVLEGGETRALLGAFAQELFGEQPGDQAGSGGTPGERPGDQAGSGGTPGERPGDPVGSGGKPGERPGGPAGGGGKPPPQVRVCLGPGGAGREIRSPLIFLLCRAGSLQPRRARARLREIARDLRSRLPRGPPAALVGVIVQPGPGEEEAAAALLETLLGEVFQEHRAGLQDTVQAAAYSPGCPDGTLEVRRAACRALRAALQHRAGGEEREKRRFPSLLRCVPWGRRSRRRGRSANAANNLHEGGLQDPEEGVALTGMSLNGNREEASRGTGA
ncbi:LOW QUALITY PROTEIN: uncharacterized protein C2orf72 homolog [Emys orbicularis]|uniref:LOW QUALITY PROTEIN: uncharacterized protein C2orf72 homolog n=1 Tax=Emys orbicularis TaxID=82168 RepID=UPI0031FDE874